MTKFDYLVVGAGFAGAVVAERLASAGRSVLIIDKRPYIGGNAHDYYDDAGILVHAHGAHVFHCNDQRVVDYLSQFTEWRPYTHRVLSSVNGKLLPVPINTTTLAAFGGDLEAARKAMIEPYTRKQWGPYAEELSPTVLARIKTRDTDDDRYFTDSFQAMPLHGYTRLFEKMLAHPSIKVMLKTSFQDVERLFFTKGRYGAGWGELDEWAEPIPEVIYTGPIDEFFDYRFGRLPYRSARFEFTTEQVNVGQPCAVINCPSLDMGFTRVVEFKWLTGQRHHATTRCWEYPCADGEPFWPVPTAASAALYKQYEELARHTPGVQFCGRLGSFRYLDMWQVVAQALKLSTSLLEQESLCPQP